MLGRHQRLEWRLDGLGAEQSGKPQSFDIVVDVHDSWRAQCDSGRHGVEPHRLGEATHHQHRLARPLGHRPGHAAVAVGHVVGDAGGGFRGHTTG